MRFALTLPFCLLIILAHFTYTTADYCKCECCTSNGCSPSLVDYHVLESRFCSEFINCKRDDCSGWHSTRCPPTGSPGQTRALCVSNSGRLLPTVILIIGMNFLIRLIKNQF